MLLLQPDLNYQRVGNTQTEPNDFPAKEEIGKWLQMPQTCL